jgi:hypothetical protein
VQTVKLQSFVKVLGATGVVFGAFVGFAGFVLSLFGADVFIALGCLPRLTGVVAGIVGLPLMPIVFACAGLLLGVVFYLVVALVFSVIPNRRNAA